MRKSMKITSNSKNIGKGMQLRNDKHYKLKFKQKGPVLTVTLGMSLTSIIDYIAPLLRRSVRPRVIRVRVETESP